MRRLITPLVLSIVVQILVSTPAHAAISWWWIDNLSGPGPFVGFENDWRVWCGGGKDDSKDRFGVESECLSGTVEEHKWSVNVSAAIYFALHNNLTYANPGGGHNVQLLRVGPSFAYVLDNNRAVEVRAGVEWDMFMGNDFPLFSRVGVPLLADIKPLAIRNPKPGKSFANMFTVRGGVLIIPQGFYPNDFGAGSGMEHKFEVIPTIGIVFDLGYRR